MRRLGSVVCCLLLAGCLDAQTVPSGQINAAPPIGYREAVKGYITQAFVDPYSIRDAAISQPFPIRHGLMGQDTIWYVCIRSNSRNRMGGYTGLTETPIAFIGNSVDAERSAYVRQHMAALNICRPAIYEPFPEVETRS
jgi:hypothetical protein